jgi:putative CocE/NonD family hydrolase
VVHLILIAFVSVVVVPRATAQQFDFPGATAEDAVTLSKSIPGLAEKVIAAYHDDDRDRHLDNLFRLQLVAGRYTEAVKSLTELGSLRAGNPSPQVRFNSFLYEVFARAKAEQAEHGTPFEEALRRSFREVLERLDNRTSALVMRALTLADVSFLRRDLNNSLARQKGKDAVSMPDALRLVRVYLAEEVYRSFAPLTPTLVGEDDERRYFIDRDIPVRTPDGATVCALVVRPRAVAGRLTALLNFTIYAEPNQLMNEARRTASNGYVGVEGLTRGKGCSPDSPVPYEHDGADAAALIEWISRQAWSDGRVGMYGGSYEGFTQWAAAKHMPKALKALMPSVTAAPAIDTPMEGNVFQNYLTYGWPFTATNTKTDEATNKDFARWSRLDREWYISGRAYRDMEKIDGTPNPTFARWLQHPTYDAFWQNMITYGKEFARVNIPVLTTTGYFDPGQMGALYYFAQHHKYNPRAEHYLLVGPYDHGAGQRGTVTPLGGTITNLAGYELDPVARIDIGELRYQWFDYVFKGGPKPALLKDRVNYEVMAANLWRHAPSLAAMGSERLRFHLSAERAGDAYRLAVPKPAGGAFIAQTVDFADRSDADRVVPGGGNVDRAIDTWNGVQFVSDPFSTPTELSGLFSGRLDFVSNKSDFDFSVQLYELTAAGEYVQLSYYLVRASHAGDRVRRRLLKPGVRTRLDFESGRLTSRQFRPGSRLVVVLTVLKQPSTQINYGTGRDVSDETIADAREPLQLRWFSDSFIDIPVRR